MIVLVLGSRRVSPRRSTSSLSDGIGDRDYAPDDRGRPPDEYRLGIGSCGSTCRQLALPAGKTHVEATSASASCTSSSRAGASVRVESHVGWGDSEVLGEDDDGHDVDTT